jgi:hypothetical protein
VELPRRQSADALVVFADCVFMDGCRMTGGCGFDEESLLGLREEGAASHG